MANGLYDEAIIDVVAPEALLSEAYPIKVSLSFHYYPMHLSEHYLGSHPQRYHYTTA